MAFTFDNLSFEVPGTTPGTADSWSFTATLVGGYKRPGFDDTRPADPLEDFGTGFHPHSTALFTENSETFRLFDGATIGFIVDSGSTDNVTFEDGDFVDIEAATAAEIASKIGTVIATLTATAVGGYVKLVSSSDDGDVQITGGTAVDKLGFHSQVDYIIESDVQTFNLTDGDTLLVAIDGGAPQTATFNTADFTDITQATAAEVAAVITTDVTGSAVSTVSGRVRIESSTARASVQMVGGTAQQILGFPALIDSFIGVGYDLDFAEFPEGGTDNEEPFETEWSGRAAALTTREKETYTLSDGMTLQVKVDSGSPQTATFNTADFNNIAQATAAEVAAVLNTDITGATATYEEGVDVTLTSDYVGYLSKLEIVGGTAETALDFPSSATIYGNSDWIGPDDEAAVFDSYLTLAEFDTSPEQHEDFEEDWNQTGWAWDFGFIAFFFEIFRSGTYTLKIEAPEYNGGISETYTQTGTDLNSMLTAFAADITTSSEIATATNDNPALTITPDPSAANIRLKLTVVSVPTTPLPAYVFVAVEKEPSSLTFANFDTGTPEAVEDFEEEWSDNENFAWSLSSVVSIVNAVDASTYRIRIDGYNCDYVSSVPPDTPSSIAASLAPLVHARPNVSAAAVGTDITITQDDDDVPFDMDVFPPNAGDMTSNEALWDGPVIADEWEDFATLAAWQKRIRVNNATTGAYTATIDGHDIVYNAGGGDTTITIASGLADAINNHTVRVDAEASVNTILLQSDRFVPAIFSLAVEAPTPGYIEVELPDAGELWTGDFLLNTIP